MLTLLAILSLLAEQDGDGSTAASLAQQAMDVAEARGVRYDPLSGFAYIALARSLARRGSLTEAEQLLTEAVPMLAIDSFALQHAHVLLDLSMVRHARGDHDGAWEAIERAEAVLAGCADPGMLAQLLDRTRHTLGRAVRGHPGPEAPLIDRELVVLRMLDTELTQQEIAQSCTSRSTPCARRSKRSIARPPPGRVRKRYRGGASLGSCQALVDESQSPPLPKTAESRGTRRCADRALIRDG